MFVIERSQSYVDPLGATSTGDKASGGMALETNEDSSYDSDFETDETCTSHADVSRTASSNTHPDVSRSSSAGLSSTHHDVSRTVSDTLGAEFAEYVNADFAIQTDPKAIPNTSKQTEDVFSQAKKIPGYTARVEFGLKLGYTEKLVQTALHKLGPNPSQNELLAELISLGAQNHRGTDSPSSHEESASHTDVCHSDNSGVQLRPIVIDGSNVAMSHGNKDIFSCRGIKICVDWFRARGHKEITVFVPKWRKEASRPDNPISDQELLNELERDRLLVFTPSRLVGGKRMVCYDDRYILKLAFEVDGIVVSNDNYRDLVHESPDYRKVVEERILMYSFVNDRFMPPDDPLGRSGPTLDSFLKLMQKRGEPPPPCPYGKKCTYGNKCKFHHPERGNLPHKSVTERLSEYAQKHMQARGVPHEAGAGNNLKTYSLPLCYDNQSPAPRKLPLGRARSAAPAAPADPHAQASVVSHFNRAQLEYQQAVNKSQDQLNRKIVSSPKSHSIENIASGIQELNMGCQSPSGRTAYPQQSNWSGMMPNEQNWLYMENQETPETGNMHRKLHRQLTLNPNYDPRLYRMHGSNQALAPPGAVRPPWSGHPAVARIASAPAACAPACAPVACAPVACAPAACAPGASCPSCPAGVSASEPHLQAPLPSWPWAVHQDARSHLNFHLSSIFPEEQVQKAMALFPDETNPQKICAAILNMFHKTA